MVRKTAARAAEEQPGLIDAEPPQASDFVPAEESIIDDVLAAMIDAAAPDVRPKLTAVAHRVSQQKHQEWLGERVYVSGARKAASEAISNRNAAIRRDHQRGERVPLLMRRYGLSRRRIEQILNG